ncbi:H-NS histone family protein [Paraburkholderia fungorum]|uniref:H-NS histone family protein n=1 Tax=Paraburkholderia fungorum TaxID=134537 RepID=UPI00161B8978|nr:H-NS histone family protein [Paraburkholderia fungorum]MBB5546594.1 DNA-binding protein H-NS [Paraburkholderia fungorum]
MATSYKELLALLSVLDEQIAKKRGEERSVIIEKIRDQMLDYGISVDELGGKKARKTSVVAAKYVDLASGKTWSGRGKPPAWIAGQDREKFLIAD